MESNPRNNPKEQSMSEWISVEDRLPEEHQSILVYYYLNKKSKHFPLRRYMTESAFYNGSLKIMM